MTESSIEFPTTKADAIQLITENFTVAAGSTSAQGLHARAYGVTHKMSPEQANNYLLSSFDNLTDSQKKHIVSNMRSLHSPNDTAKQSIGNIVKSFSRMKAPELIREQLPNEDSLDSVIVAAQKKSISEQELDRALQSSWSQDSEERIRNLKSIAAYLDMYDDDNINWWQNLDNLTKHDMITQGQSFFTGTEG